MGKVIRLTESQLKRIIQNIMNENTPGAPSPSAPVKKPVQSAPIVRKPTAPIIVNGIRVWDGNQVVNDPNNQKTINTYIESMKREAQINDGNVGVWPNNPADENKLLSIALNQARVKGSILDIGTNQPVKVTLG